MTMPGAGAVMGAIETRLQDGFAAKVSALNTEYADSITLTAPETSSYHRMLDPADRDAMLALSTPAVILRPEVEEPVGGRALGGEYAIRTPIEVSIVTGYDTSERQGEALLRYQRALKELLLHQNSATGDSAYDFEASGFARTWTTDNGVLRDVAIVVSTVVFETP
jgi:hypothetical protein